MGAQTRLTVDQLKTINPQLLAQIEKTAIEKLELKRKEARTIITHPPIKLDNGSSEENMSDRFKNRMIGGFICEQPIVFDLGSAYDLTLKLKEWDPKRPSYAGTESLKDASIYSSNRLSELLKSLDKPPILPALVSGLLILNFLNY